jgi:hypothetical protein
MLRGEIAAVASIHGDSAHAGITATVAALIR